MGETGLPKRIWNWFGDRKTDGRGSEVFYLAEFTTPKVEGQWCQVAVFPRQITIAQEIGDCIVGVGLEPMERSTYDFFGVTVEFQYEWRQKAEGVSAQRTKETSDRNRIRFCEGNEVAHIAPVPPKARRLLAELALIWL